MPNSDYEILQYSVCDGWVNNLLDGAKNPYIFATLAEAVAKRQEEFNDWNAEIQADDRDKDDGYDISHSKLNAQQPACCMSLI
jgi:hypothetical protein